MKSKEPGTIRQLFAFVGENNGKMLLSIFLAVLGELFGICSARPAAGQVSCFVPGI